MRHNACGVSFIGGKTKNKNKKQEFLKTCNALGLFKMLELLSEGNFWVSKT
jgi:hypothetical protein